MKNKLTLQDWQDKFEKEINTKYNGKLFWKEFILDKNKDRNWIINVSFVNNGGWYCEHWWTIEQTLLSYMFDTGYDAKALEWIQNVATINYISLDSSHFYNENKCYLYIQLNESYQDLEDFKKIDDEILVNIKLGEFIKTENCQENIEVFRYDLALEKNNWKKILFSGKKENCPFNILDYDVIDYDFDSNKKILHIMISWWK